MQNLLNVLRSRSSRDRRKRRRFGVESLEARLLLHAEGLPWAAPNLTISFAPDGTHIAGYESSLFQSLDASGTTDAWQDAVLRGFENWAQHAAATVTATSDSGDPFGTPGPTQGDVRFGDVRVGAVPMAGDIIAMSVPHDEVISGTWAGDVLFNSNAAPSGIDEIFAIAVHEAGHVFGLGHSDDPSSPMYLHGISTVVTPTAEDIAALQSLYGAPESGDAGDDGGQDEAHDLDEDKRSREHEDDKLVTATGLVLSPSFQGAIRYDASGQIFDTTDVDFYQLTPIADEFKEAKVLTVTVRSTTPHGLIPLATIVNHEGEVIESTVLANANGQLIIQAEADPRKTQFVSVRAMDPTGEHATGAYDIVATIGTREVKLDRIAKGSLEAEEPDRTSLLHVSETRLVHFLLQADPNDDPTNSAAWVVIYNKAGELVFNTAARPGESRSANTVLLTPGDYRIEFHGQTADGSELAEIEYRLLTRSISIPIGPDPINPLTIPILPCSNPGSDPVYCYPDDVSVIDPLILPPPTPYPVPPPIVVIPPPWTDPALWYWNGISLVPSSGSGFLRVGASVSGTSKPASPGTTAPTATATGETGSSNSGSATGSTTTTSSAASWQNASQPHDVNADGHVSPADALVVIDYLNSGQAAGIAGEHPPGTPYLDVNNDSFVSPRDALLVINALNGSSVNAAAEGEASASSQATAIPVAWTRVPSNVQTTKAVQGENARRMETRDSQSANVVERPLRQTGSATGSARRVTFTTVVEESLDAIASDIADVWNDTDLESWLSCGADVSPAKL